MSVITTSKQRSNGYALVPYYTCDATKKKHLQFYRVDENVYFFLSISDLLKKDKEYTSSFELSSARISEGITIVIPQKEEIIVTETDEKGNVGRISSFY